MGSLSCQFLEIREGVYNGQEFIGTAGLLRLKNNLALNETVPAMETCQFFNPMDANLEVNLRIAIYSGWIAPIAAAVGVLVALVHTLVLPVLMVFITLSYAASILCLSHTLFLLATNLCMDCSLGVGAYFTIFAIPLAMVPCMLTICSPPPVPPLVKKGVEGAEDLALGGQGEDETDEEYQARKNKQEMAVVGRVARMAVTGGL